MLTNAEQKLLQTLVYDLLRECIRYVRRGRKGRLKEQQFNINMRALREIDDEYLTIAGFSDKWKIKEIINNLLSGNYDCFLQTKRLRLSSAGK